ncbi:MAG: MerR family transcriptional regulator [Actinomycetota bacterium]|nr:MerR family transcriptional regulator [Actinomycetota bacterium]
MVAEEKKYSIGEVQDMLKKEFPDISISKIRFLEKEGLISPERTASGYRKYSVSNIKELSYILRLQREDYLPLSVIKRKMQDLKSGKVIAGDLTMMSGPGTDSKLGSGIPVSVELAPSKLGIRAETLDELMAYGIVHPSEGPEGKYFNSDDIKILMLSKEFTRYGVEPRHLTMFIHFVSREAAFIEQIIRPQLLHKDPSAKRSAIKDLENLITLCEMFSSALLKSALSKYLPRPSTMEFSEEQDLDEEQDLE